ncbi:MAG: D-alanyl-D-alanine carboxypeptidase, partial [Proteobacteria bacterium]|nr:D-alanyl-D-alanine carboxypeptidase [Pseudomonadota bacterium]
EGVTVTLSRKARRDMRVTVVYDAPIPAPLQAGQEVARLVVTAPGEEPVEFPLIAGADVERLGIFGRITTSLEYLVFGAQ